MLGANLTTRLVPVAGTPAWVPHIALCTGDVTVNDSTPLVDITGMNFPIGANEVWFVEGKLVITSPSTASDFRLGWTYPANCTMLWGATGIAALNIAGFGFTLIGSTPAVLLTQAGTLSGGSANGTYGTGFAAIITNGANAGTIQLQGAQNTATVENTAFEQNSVMTFWRLARKVDKK